MKIEANVTFQPSCMHDYNGFGVAKTTVDVDVDYVGASESEVNEWIAAELNEMYGINFVPEQDFIVENIDDVIEDIELLGKTQL